MCLGKALVENLDLSATKFAGTSAGALVATALIVGSDFTRLAEVISLQLPSVALEQLPVALSNIVLQLQKLSPKASISF